MSPPTCQSLLSSATPGWFSRLTDVALAPVLSPEDAATDVDEDAAGTDVETLLAEAVFDLGSWREKIFKSKFNGIHTHAFNLVEGRGGGDGGACQKS